MWGKGFVLLYVTVISSGRAQVLSANSGGNGIQNSCTNTQIGEVTSNSRYMAYKLEANRSSFDISIPDQGCKTVGISVSVCETGNTSTEVKLASLTQVSVRRNGNLSQAGQADIVIYC